MKQLDLWINGKHVRTKEQRTVYNKATGQPIASMSVAGPDEVRAAVDAAQHAFDTVEIPPYDRYTIILKAADLMMARQEEFAAALSEEAGKPLKDARGEIGRAYQTLILSAEEAKRFKGETIPIAGAPGCSHRRAYTIRRPLGVVCAITPFNFPVNLACHKIGPAIAAGNTVVYKPASFTPVTAAMLCEVFHEAGLPAGCLNLLLGPGSLVGDLLTKDQRIRMFSFTGSVPVGKSLQVAAGFRRCALELGSNSANIVHGDVKDVKKAAEMCARYAFTNAGQVCISCQRVYVERPIYDEFVQAAAAYAKTFCTGNLADEKTCLGPMIAEKEAKRIESWVNAAVEGGATIVTGGHRNGSYYEPTILTNVTPDMDVVCKEVFAPVFSITPYDTIEDAVSRVNDSRYGLQAGVFTSSLSVAHYCAENIETGGVIINDGSSFRMDNMPYGGVKDSGIGKEGPEYAVRELTEEKLVVLNF